MSRALASTGYRAVAGARRVQIGIRPDSWAHGTTAGPRARLHDGVRHSVYQGSIGTTQVWRRGPVEEVSLERFAHGRSIRVRPDRKCFDARSVVERARSRLGERGYRILTNNCEHFCMWALCNEHRSAQVERLHRMLEAVRLLYERVIETGLSHLRTA